MGECSYFPYWIFDHNYKMLVNILFIGRPCLARLVNKFSAVNSMQIIPVDRYKSYFKPKMGQFDPLAKSILEMMATSNCNKSVLENKLQSYREVEYNRHPKGLVSLVCALNECKDIQIRQYGLHLIEFIIRSHDVHKFVCDQTELTAILIQFALKRSQSFEKIKQTMVKYKLAQLLLANQSSIFPNHFLEIINFFVSNQRLAVTLTNRFMTLSTIFQEKMFVFLKDYLENRLGYNESRIINETFIHRLFNYLAEYPTQKDSHAQLLFEFVDKAVFSQSGRLRKMTVYSIHRNFPYSARTPQGELYKDLILRKIIQRSKRGLDEGEDWNESLLNYSILSFQFYKTMDSLQFRYEIELNYLKKQDLKVPELPTIFWETYKHNPRLINKDHIARNILKRVYTDRYISTPDLESNTIKPPKITQNQIKLRMSSALAQLGLKWQREVEISGRYVDFLLEDVVIECDGDYHFDLYKMDYNQTTQFRNLHLLLSGYRLLILNIFQYNRHRTTAELAKLIQRKLAYLNSSQAVMIV